MTSTVYVGCVTYNSMNDLNKCIDGLRQQTYPSLKLVFLDNASKDGSAAWLEQFDDIDILRLTENVGFANAHNQIIQHCDIQDGDYYLALNPDTELNPNYIEEIVSFIADRSEIGWSIGKLLLSEAPNRIYSTGHVIRRDGYAINNGYGVIDNGQYDEPRPIFGASGAAVIYKGRFINDLTSDGAFFDPRFFLYIEDVDVDWRGQRRGWQCWYCPTAVALHRGGTASQRHEALTVANRFLSIMKNAFWSDLLLYNLPLIVMHLTFRLITTPESGSTIARHVLRHSWKSIRLRKRSKISHRSMMFWFTEVTDSDQPLTSLERAQSFLSKQNKKLLIKHAQTRRAFLDSPIPNKQHQI